MPDDSVETAVRNIIAASLERDPDMLDEEMSLVSLGADRADIFDIKHHLEQKFGRCEEDVEAVLVNIFDHAKCDDVSGEARDGLRDVFGIAKLTRIKTYADAQELVTICFLIELSYLAMHGGQLAEE